MFAIRTIAHKLPSGAIETIARGITLHLARINIGIYPIFSPITERGIFRLKDDFTRKAFAFVASAIVFETFVMRLGFALGGSISADSTRAPFNDPAIWAFAIPFAAASLLVAMLADTQLGVMTGV